MKSTVTSNRNQRGEAQNVTGQINQVAKANLLQKETSVIATMDQFGKENSEIEKKMQDLKNNVLNVSETLSGKSFNFSIFFLLIF